MLSPAIDVAVALSDPVVRAVRPVAQPLLIVLLTRTMAVRGFVGEAFAATLEPVLFNDGPADLVIAPRPITARPDTWDHAAVKDQTGQAGTPGRRRASHRAAERVAGATPTSSPD